MGVYKFSAPGTLKTGRTLFTSMLAGNATFVDGSYESIATTTVGAGGAASITFSSIPSTYQHLQVRGIAKSTSTGSQGDLTINGDTAANYAWHQIFGNGSSAGADNSINRNNIVGAAALVDSTYSNVFSASVIDILDYKDTNKFKTVRFLVGQDENGTGVITFNSGLYRSTSAITSLTITARTNSIAQHSTFALYGIRG